MLDAEGVLVLPATMYRSEISDAVPMDHFRVGIGRAGLEEGVAAFDRFLRTRNDGRGAARLMSLPGRPPRLTARGRHRT